jgi:hypothetical protein
MIGAAVRQLINTVTDPTFGRAMVKSGFGAVGPLRSVPGVSKMVPVTATSPLDLFDYDRFQKAVSSESGNIFFSGRSLQIGSSGKHSFTAPDAAIGRSRMVGAGVMAGLLGSSALGIDPFGAVSAATSVGAFGSHALLGSAMYRMGGKGKVLGTGYLGLLGYNTLQAGNQPGPL